MSELLAFNWTQKRLAFLCREESLFREIDNICYKDHRGKFVVFYKMERKGRLFEFYEFAHEKGKRYKFVFPTDVGLENVEIVTDNFSDIDESLFCAFTAQVAKLGR